MTYCLSIFVYSKGVGEGEEEEAATALRGRARAPNGVGDAVIEMLYCFVNKLFFAYFLFRMLLHEAAFGARRSGLRVAFDPAGAAVSITYF